MRAQQDFKIVQALRNRTSTKSKVMFMLMLSMCLITAGLARKFACLQWPHLSTVKLTVSKLCEQPIGRYDELLHKMIHNMQPYGACFKRVVLNGHSQPV